LELKLETDGHLSPSEFRFSAASKRSDATFNAARFGRRNGIDAPLRLRTLAIEREAGEF